jgi:hypothetical protein
VRILRLRIAFSRDAIRPDIYSPHASNLVNCNGDGMYGPTVHRIGGIVNSPLPRGTPTNGEQVDLSGNGSSIAFTNCLYCSKPDAVHRSRVRATSNFAAGRSYGFVGPEANPEHPYALAYSFPARDKGLTIKLAGRDDRSRGASARVERAGGHSVAMNAGSRPVGTLIVVIENGAEMNRAPEVRRGFSKPTTRFLQKLMTDRSNGAGQRSAVHDWAEGRLSKTAAAPRVYVLYRTIHDRGKHPMYFFNRMRQKGANHERGLGTACWA